MKHLYPSLPAAWAVAILSSSIPRLACGQDAASASYPGRLVPVHYVGAGLGNGLGAEAGWFGRRVALLGRVRYAWWLPQDIRRSSKLFDGYNTRSRQTEYAALAGYPLPVAGGVVTAAAGLAYVHGRQLDEFRYARKGLFGNSYVFSYTRYQALGVPVQLSWVAATPNIGSRTSVRAGVSLQANFNPVQPDFTLLVNLLWCRHRLTTSAAL